MFCTLTTEKKIASRHVFILRSNALSILFIYFALPSVKDGIHIFGFGRIARRARSPAKIEGFVRALHFATKNGSMVGLSFTD